MKAILIDACADKATASEMWHGHLAHGFSLFTGGTPVPRAASAGVVALPACSFARERLNRSIPALALTAILLSCIGDAHAQSSPSYEITRSVMSGGGGRSTSPSYSLTGTLGQPSPVEVSDSASYNLGSGFWGATVKLFTVAIESLSYSVAEGVRITWHSLANATYTIYCTDVLGLSTIWDALSTLPGTGALMEWLDDGSLTGTPPTAASILKRFYRLLVQPGGS